MSLRMFIAWLGVALVIVGIILGFVGVSTTMTSGMPASCGSAFAPSGTVDIDFSSGVNSRGVCSDALSSRRLLSLIILGIGAVGLIGAIAVKSPRPEDVARQAGREDVA